MGSEYGRGGHKIRKWVKPIRIYVEHTAGDASVQDQVLEAHLDHLRGITSLDIKRVDAANKANLHFFFTRQSQLKKVTTRYSGARVAALNTQNTCFANIKVTPNAEVYSGQIYIPVDFAYAQGKLVACIVEEMTQILGLPRDSEKVFPSIFNDKSHNELLTGLDETLLRILYDKSVKPGMARASARTAAQKVISKLKRQGHVSRADAHAQQAPLVAMLY